MLGCGKPKPQRQAPQAEPPSGAPLRRVSATSPRSRPRPTQRSSPSSRNRNHFRGSSIEIVPLEWYSAPGHEGHEEAEMPLDTDAYVQGHDRTLFVWHPDSPVGQGEAPEGGSSSRCSQASSSSTVADLLLLHGVDACGPGHERTEDAAFEEASDSPAGNGGVPVGASSSTHLAAVSGTEAGGEVEEEEASRSAAAN